MFCVHDNPVIGPIFPSLLQPLVFFCQLLMIKKKKLECVCVHDPAISHTLIKKNVDN